MKTILMVIFQVSTAFVMLFPIILGLGFLSGSAGAFCHTMFVMAAWSACISIISFFLWHMID